jgi:hypothetical protein
MSRDSRPPMQGSPGESRWYMLAVGFDPDIEFEGKAACQIARVKMDQIFDEESGGQDKLPEMKEMKQLEAEEENTKEEGMMTRGRMAKKVLEEKRKSVETIMLEGKAVQPKEGPIESKSKKQRIKQEEQKDLQGMGKKEEREIRPEETRWLNVECMGMGNRISRRVPGL